MPCLLGVRVVRHAVHTHAACTGQSIIPCGHGPYGLCVLSRVFSATFQCCIPGLYLNQCAGHCVLLALFNAACQGFKYCARPCSQSLYYTQTQSVTSQGHASSTAANLAGTCILTSNGQCNPYNNCKLYQHPRAKRCTSCNNVRKKGPLAG